jgi:uncharacterized glyoxalase superfamily protein PhnB
MNAELPAAVPEIPVGTIAAAADYYRQCLGFTIDWGDDELGLAGISRGGCRLFLASAEYRQGRGTGPATTWLNLDSSEDVDELHRGWAAANATMISAPEAKPWGLYEFTAADPDGNRFRVFYDFATPQREAAGS